MASLRLKHAGTFRKVPASQVTGTQVSCDHPIVMKDMCADCGADLRETINNTPTNAVVAMVHNIPELMVSMKVKINYILLRFSLDLLNKVICVLQEAQSLGKADEERLLKDRKLVLLVDLDQTLIHTTNDNIPDNIEVIIKSLNIFIQISTH